MAQGDDRLLNCTDACGAEPIEDSETAIALNGWQRLPITGRYRCMKCRRDLEAVNAKSREADAKESK